MIPEEMASHPTSPDQGNALSDPFDVFLKDFERVSTQNRRRISFFLDLMQEFRAAGIKALPLKGMDLLIRAYPSAGMRPMEDIDLLILRQDVRKVMAFFTKKGFTRRPDEGLTYLSPDFSVNLDILWNFWYFNSSAGIQNVWKRTVLRTFQDAEVEVLHPEDAFIYQMAYVVMHRGVLSETFARDLRFFLEKEETFIDWRALKDQIKRLKLRPAFFHGLCYALQKEELNVPEKFPDSFRPASLNEKIMARILQQQVNEAPQPEVSYFFTWLGYPGWRGKLRLLREKMLPSRFELEINRGITSKQGYWGFVLSHPFLLLIRTGHFLLTGFGRILKRN